MSPRNDDKGNYDDTEFPPDSENADNALLQPASRETDSNKTDSNKRHNAGDEGDYDDKDQ
jgi:hypothetical protein